MNIRNKRRSPVFFEKRNMQNMDLKDFFGRLESFSVLEKLVFSVFY